MVQQGSDPAADTRPVSGGASGNAWRRWGLAVAAGLTAVVLAVLAVGWWIKSTSSGPPATTGLRGEPPRAQAAGKAVPAQSPTSPEQAAIAALLQEALAEAQQLTVRFPRRAEAVHAAAVAYYELGRATEAERYWNRVLELDPKAHDTYRWLAYVAMDRGQYAQAAAFYRQLLARDPDSADARLGLAETYVQLGDMPAARRLLEQEAQGEQPEAGPACLLLGQVCLELHDYGPARESFLKAARLMPRAPQPYYGLSQACARLGEAAQSADYQRRFRKLAAQERRALRDTAAVPADLAEARGKTPGILAALAETYAACGERQEAERLQRRAAEIRQAASAEERRHARP